MFHPIRQDEDIAKPESSETSMVPSDRAADSIERFYDDLADNYHLIFPDWPGPVFRQGAILDQLITAEIGPTPHSLLDCSCGIGTQAIGLALRGYTVHATDLSPREVERARREAEALGASLTFGVADFLWLTSQVPGTFDAAITCDNSLPHLLTDEDLHRAARNIRSKLNDRGLFLASMRDYDRLIAEKPRVQPPRIFDATEGRRIVFQVWDWADDGRTYVVHLFIVRQNDDAWSTIHQATTYRALLRDQLSAILLAEGFAEIRWLMPEESGYYQPVVLARRNEHSVARVAEDHLVLEKARSNSPAGPGTLLRHT